MEWGRDRQERWAASLPGSEEHGPLRLVSEFYSGGNLTIQWIPPQCFIRQTALIMKNIYFWICWLWSTLGYCNWRKFKTGKRSADVRPKRLECQTRKVQKLVCGFEKGTVLRKSWCSKQCDSGQKSFIEEKNHIFTKSRCLDHLFWLLSNSFVSVSSVFQHFNEFWFSSLALLSKFIWIYFWCLN